MNIITIGTCTQNNLNQSFPLKKSIDKLCQITDINSNIIYENKQSISKCYNKIIEEEIKLGTKYLILAHDDLYINDLFFFEKLDKGFKDNDILGLAGASELNIKRGLLGQHKKISWHTCSDQNNWSGAVAHPFEETNKIYMSSFGIIPKECISLDGLFLAINLHKIGDLRFDEKFNFDFYDLTFCINAYQKKLKLSTIDIFCTHISHGKGILTENFNKQQQIFLDNYCKGENNG